MYTIKGVGQFAANQTLQNGTSLLLSKALGQGGSASDALKSALFNTLAAASFNAVGDYTKQFGIENGSLPKIAIHAMVGGLLSKATGGDFRTGALAGGANEALVVQLDKLVGGNENLLTMSSQIVGVLAAASQEDADASSLDKAAWVAKNGTQYNYLEHLDVLAFAKDMNGCGTDESCQTDKWIKEKYDDESLRNVEDAQNTYGPQRAKEKSLQIAQSIDTLMSVQCTTARCETYKTALLERSIDSYARLSKVLNEWAPTLDRLGLVGGAAAGKQAGSRPVGVPERAELAQVQRAVDYLAGAKATASLEKEVGTYFGQQRKYWSQEPIQYNGNKVYQRNDLIDPGRVDSQTGLTNKQLMENGLAPYGADGKKINLHHMLQTQDGPIA